MYIHSSSLTKCGIRSWLYMVTMFFPPLSYGGPSLFKLLLWQDSKHNGKVLSASPFWQQLYPVHTVTGLPPRYDELSRHPRRPEVLQWDEGRTWSANGSKMMYPFQCPHCYAVEDESTVILGFLEWANTRHVWPGLLKCFKKWSCKAAFASRY